LHHVKYTWKQIFSDVTPGSEAENSKLTINMFFILLKYVRYVGRWLEYNRWDNGITIKPLNLSSLISVFPIPVKVSVQPKWSFMIHNSIIFCLLGASIVFSTEYFCIQLEERIKREWRINWKFVSWANAQSGICHFFWNFIFIQIIIKWKGKWVDCITMK
jgi:hypothetical protein